ncbi:MAG: ABC transporter permease [Thermodesulfobacteriota bacterium]|nr:ABC transporter permease [Thermodesulfobacteriota bacterium]
MNWKRIKSLLKKEFVQALRDRRMRVLIFGAPLIQLLVFGYAVNTDIRNLNIVVYDRSNTSISRELIDTFRASDYFKVVGSASSHQEAENMLNTGKAQVAIFIPDNFTRNLRRLKKGDLQIVVEGTDSIVAQKATSYSSMITYAFLDKKMRNIKNIPAATKGTKVPWIDPEIRIWFNPDLKSRNFFIPGIIALLLTLVSVLLTSFSIVKEWEIGTMEQLIVTPIRPIELIAGKTIPFFIIGIIDLVLIFTVGTLWFNVPFRGDLLFLAISAILYLINTLGIGLFISAISRTQQQAMMTTFFYFMPSVLLSGFVFPVYNIPVLLRWIAYINPMTYFLVILRGMFLKGVGIEVLWPQILFLISMGSLLFIFSVKMFHRSLD